MQIKNELVVKQQQILSDRQIQSLKILAFSNQELNEFLTNEFLENPMLEAESGKKNDMLVSAEQFFERNSSPQDFSAGMQEEDETGKREIADQDRGKLEEMLLSQLDSRKYTVKQWKLFKELIQCLNADGFLTFNTEELSSALHTSGEEIENGLSILKELEPVGVFSAGISECLIRQIRKNGWDNDILVQIVENFLPDILHGHIANITRTLHLSTIQVRKYIGLIGKLNPHPVINSEENSPQYIIPDIIIKKLNGRYEISLNDHWIGEYRCNDFYVRMMQQSADADLVNYFRERLKRADFVISSVEQRRNTLIKIAEAILKRQKDFFEYGLPLKPMTMEEIAEQTEMNTSTVSRAVRGKYIQYYHTYSLRSLFTAPVSETGTDHEMASEEVKKRMIQIIKNEKKEKPLSDLLLMRSLHDYGIRISRRTIAKYRKELGIPDSRERCYMELQSY